MHLKLSVRTFSYSVIKPPFTKSPSNQALVTFSISISTYGFVRLTSGIALRVFVSVMKPSGIGSFEGLDYFICKINLITLISLATLNT